VQDAITDRTAVETEEKFAIKSRPTAQGACAPHIALLGWCERAALIQNGPSALWHTNIVGRTPSDEAKHRKLRNVFPGDVELYKYDDLLRKYGGNHQARCQSLREEERECPKKLARNSLEFS
jgi:hypothetical protein